MFLYNFHMTVPILLHVLRQISYELTMLLLYHDNPVSRKTL
jgi:hypothetical protein